jgi:hypothetical protein
MKLRVVRKGFIHTVQWTVIVQLAITISKENFVEKVPLKIRVLVTAKRLL